MEHKTFPAFTTKIEDDLGVVDAIVAVMGNVDEGDDVIHPGAFTKTVLERGTKIRVLDQHRTDSIMNVLGKPLEVREIRHDELPTEVLTKFPDATGGLWTRTQYLMSTPEGKGAFIRIKEGAVDEYSIGYDPVPKGFDFSKAEDGRTIRNLCELKLYEYSPVLWAMNAATGTLSAKEKRRIPHTIGLCRSDNVQPPSESWTIGSFQPRGRKSRCIVAGARPAL